MLRVTLLAFAWFAVFPAPVPAQSVDPHALYEEKCAMCHAPHAGDFAMQSLERAGGDVVTKSSGRLLDAMLRHHRGITLAQDEIDALIEQFEFILQLGGTFRDKCIICHDRAAEFARLKLKEDGGRLVGRYSGRDVADLLLDHGRLTAQERDVIVGMLMRQLSVGEGRPAE